MSQTLLNKKVGHLQIKPGSLTTELYAAQSVTDAKMLDATLSFLKTNPSFAAALLDTQKRAVYPLIGGVAKTLPAAGSMVVTSDFSGVTPSTAAPSYNSGTRTWTNLGAVVYASDNKVLLRAAGPSGQPDGTDSVRTSAGNEVYGRLTHAAGVWTVTFYHAPAGVETAYSLPATVSAFIAYKHWVTLSNSLLEDQGKAIVTAPGAVDISERNDLVQIASDLGITLSNTGAFSNPFASGKSVIQRLVDHIAATSDRHSTSDVDCHVNVDISGFTDGGTLTVALNQIQSNINAVSTAGNAALKTFTDELRSNGVLGTPNALSAGSGLNVSIAALTAYVKGDRFVRTSTSQAVPGNTTTYLWVDAAGAVQQGASYPGDLTLIAKLGRVTTNSTIVTGVVDDHLALVELDQKVYDVESALNAHAASATAHPLANVTYDNTSQPLTLPDNTTPVTDGQEAIESVVRRMNVSRFRTMVKVLIQTDIDNATVDGALRYIAITLPGGQSYEVGQDMMTVFYNGSLEELGRAYTEQSSTEVRFYFDPTDPLEADDRIFLRWFNL